nr:hypothetical protein BaRGS_032450 [Batillaria attramentaria]
MAYRHDDEKGGVDNPVFVTDGSTRGVSTDGVYVNVDDDKNELRQRQTNNHHGDGHAGDVNGDDVKNLTGCGMAVYTVQSAVYNFCSKNKETILLVIKLVLLLAYFCYFGYAMYCSFGDEGSYRLIVCTILGVIILILHLTSSHIAMARESLCGGGGGDDNKGNRVRTIIRWSLYVMSTIAMVTLLIVLVALETPENLISLAGLAGFIIIAYITSINPARVNWHPVFWGFSLQFYFAVIILKTRWGFDAFEWLGDRVTEFLAYSDEGAMFVFGDNFRVHFFAFAILPTIVFFSAAISTLYYLGVMQAIVGVGGRFLAFCLGTTPAESINAAGNIFVGMTEAPLMIRPFIGRMTRSELHAVMTGGFATIAGSVLGAYIGFGVPANHLLSASVMSAPAALAISKLTYPETEQPMISDDDYTKMDKPPERNLIEAASSGASNAIALVANVAVNVMAFLSILKFVNATLTWFGDRVGVEDLTFQLICSYVLYPVALFMGTEPRDCRRIAELVGIKTFTNEFIAYASLQKLLVNGQDWANYTTLYNISEPGMVEYDGDDILLLQWNKTLEKGVMTRRSEVIATYALCGFSNFGSMGILLGGLSAMAPDRRHDLAAIVLRAMIAGNIACFFTACIAGLFFQDFD